MRSRRCQSAGRPVDLHTQQDHKLNNMLDGTLNNDSQTFEWSQWTVSSLAQISPRSEGPVSIICLSQPSRVTSGISTAYSDDSAWIERGSNPLVIARKGLGPSFAVYLGCNDVKGKSIVAIALIASNRRCIGDKFQSSTINDNEYIWISRMY